MGDIVNQFSIHRNTPKYHQNVCFITLSIRTIWGYNFQYIQNSRACISYHDFDD